MSISGYFNSVLSLFISVISEERDLSMDLSSAFNRPDFSIRIYFCLCKEKDKIYGAPAKITDMRILEIKS
jgi:hypothetical protein